MDAVILDCLSELGGATDAAQIIARLENALCAKRRSLRRSFNSGRFDSTDSEWATDAFMDRFMPQTRWRFFHLESPNSPWSVKAHPRRLRRLQFTERAWTGVIRRAQTRNQPYRPQSKQSGSSATHSVDHVAEGGRIALSRVQSSTHTRAPSRSYPYRHCWCASFSPCQRFRWRLHPPTAAAPEALSQKRPHLRQRPICCERTNKPTRTPSSLFREKRDLTHARHCRQLFW
jgi:hypothetical protein